MKAATQLTGEHAEDVLSTLGTWLSDDKDSALVFVTSTQGGAVRAPGALLAVTDDDSVGYISGGCIDADVELQARMACETGAPKALRYGAGSPFVDLPLPCGGAIEVLIVPHPDREIIRLSAETLKRRQGLDLLIAPSGEIRIATEADTVAADELRFFYAPKLRLRIAGRGADALALAKIAEASGCETRLQLVDDEDIADANAAGLLAVEKLQTPSDPPVANDDPWTAFVLLFHDSDWEVPLLRQALDGDAFYIGAVGSKRTHRVRCDALRDAGCSEADIDRVRGPIGLIPSLRDASMLAVSALAEIVDAFPGKSSSRRSRTAVLMLAAGASSRFENGDKLLADLNGKPVLDWSASRVPNHETLSKFAVVRSIESDRAKILRQHGWTLIENPDAHLGQSKSVKAGVAAISAQAEFDQVIITLADMPFVPAAHLEALCKRADTSSRTAIMTEADGRLSPPALFTRTHFPALMELSGDQGAKALFLSLPLGSDTCALAKELAEDIDNETDMLRIKESTHA